ncbi:DUF6076 domain-containing protein [Catenibacillus scindens]|uniref:DUF6076 domain-containing protein n=1 Tax=Catenibacillus scindens TaxID=673271 RepID=UPI00320ABD25
MSNQENLYIHVYIPIGSEMISYRNPDEIWEIGQSLLDFIYKDFSGQSSSDRGSYELSRLREIHPYFRHISGDSLKLFRENSLSPSYEGVFCQAGLVKLQKSYEDWLSCYVSQGVSSELMEVAGKYRFYAQSHYVMDQGRPSTDYFLLGFEDCLYLEFSEMIRQKVLVKVCKNCGRLFIPKKSNVDYCHRVYTEDGKTCQDVGYSQTFARSVKNDDLLLAYTRAYKAHYARMSKPRKRAGNLSREDFEKWYQEAKDKLNQARSGALDGEEFKAWLKK